MAVSATKFSTCSFSRFPRLRDFTLQKRARQKMEESSPSFYFEKKNFVLMYGGYNERLATSPHTFIIPTWPPARLREKCLVMSPNHAFTKHLDIPLKQNIKRGLGNECRRLECSWLITPTIAIIFKHCGPTLLFFRNVDLCWPSTPSSIFNEH